MASKKRKTNRSEPLSLGARVRGFILSPSELDDYLGRLAENAAEIGVLVGSDLANAVNNMRAKEGDIDSPNRLVNNAIVNAALTLTDTETRSPEFYDTQDWYLLCDQLALSICNGELHPTLKLDKAKR